MEHENNLSPTEEELKKVKGLVAARTAVAWMGMVSSIWQHRIVGDAIAIRRYSELLRHKLKDQLQDEEISRFLDAIDNLVKSILTRPITPPLSEEEGLETIFVNDFLRECFSQLKSSNTLDPIQIVWNLEEQAPVMVRANKQWLRKCVEVLVDNAVEAMNKASRKSLMISTTANNNKVEISITDTGPGIPKEILPILFQNQVQSSKGLGMGLLMADMIVMAYGGKLSVAESGPAGTSMVITLPQWL